MTLVKPKDIPIAKDTPEDNLVEVYKTCLLMEKLCLESNGIALSAVQIGIPWNLFVIPSQQSKYFLNCKYEGIGEKKSSVEGCLSLKDGDSLRLFRVERYVKIRLIGKELVIEENNLATREIDTVVDGTYTVVVYQHEIDHNLGKLISDIGHEVQGHVGPISRAEGGANVK